ncbi:MAG: ubiquinol oxidase subunit II [bacterium]|nr:ubiquinol oxidase subunit II [bacterium]
MFSVLEPAGVVALAERTLMINATLLMLIVVVPLFVLAFFVAWHWRAGNKKATYMPNWEHSKMDELVWWAIPFEIVLVLGALTWTSTHQLDPRKPLDDARGEPPLVIQVVALEWKWLFIYPEQHIATINMLELPVGRPVEFEITADAPMNSFWIPRLGGQIYAMTGMVTRLNLIATQPGVFAGGSANYSGSGFAQMKFTVHAVPVADFNAWVQTTASSSQILDTSTYNALAQPNIQLQPQYYALPDTTLYNSIVEKFMSIGPEKSLSPAAERRGNAFETNFSSPTMH